MLTWLLDVDMGGRVVRVSSRPAVVDGKLYEGTLDAVDLVEQIDGVGTIPNERRAQISFSPRDSLLDYAQLEGRAKLYLWDGETAPTLQLVGTLISGEVSGPGEPVAAVLTADSYTDRAPLLAPTARVTPETWPSAPQDAVGRWYPRVYGQPGRMLLRGTLVSERTWEVIPVATTSGNVDKLLLFDAANHRQPLRVDVSAVSDDRSLIFGQTFGAADPGPAPVLETDGYGRPVWVLDVSGQVAGFRKADRFYASVLDADSPTRPRSSGRPVSTVGDVLRELAFEADIDTDAGEWSRLCDSLPYRAATVVREPASPMELAADIIRDLPVALYSTPNGLGALRWPYDAQRVDAVARLVEGSTCARLSGLRQTRDPADASGVVMVEYGWRDYGQRYGHAVYADSVVAAAVDLLEVTTDAWSRSADRGGAVQTIEAGWMADSAGAIEIARWRMAGAAIGAMELDLDVDARLARYLLLGSVVVLTVPSLGIDDRLGIVSGRTLSDGAAWVMTFVLLSNVGTLRPITPPDPMGAPTIVLDPPPEQAEPSPN